MAVIALLAYRQPSAVGASILYGFAALCSVVFVGVILRRRWAGLLGLGLMLVPLGLCAFQTLRRLFFVARHGGMDAGEPAGSPMAFLIGWVFEWVCLGLPAILLLYLLIVWTCLHGDRATGQGFPVEPVATQDAPTPVDG